MLRNLVLSFDNEDGHAESIFQHTSSLITLMLGQRAADSFSKHIDSANDMFFLRRGTGQECWDAMLEKSHK